ncbi:hypothetical protein BJ742DRAFT_872727 [Cladochytrium replicatum]|nr:hypothetical protein BJ742DRAFT_872727 [Cladochytrium replicatum]
MHQSSRETQTKRLSILGSTNLSPNQFPKVRESLMNLKSPPIDPGSANEKTIGHDSRRFPGAPVVSVNRTVDSMMSQSNRSSSDRTHQDPWLRARLQQLTSPTSSPPGNAADANHQLPHERLKSSEKFSSPPPGLLDEGTNKALQYLRSPRLHRRSRAGTELLSAFGAVSDHDVGDEKRGSRLSSVAANEHPTDQEEIALTNVSPGTERKSITSVRRVSSLGKFVRSMDFSSWGTHVDASGKSQVKEKEKFLKCTDPPKQVFERIPSLDFSKFKSFAIYYGPPLTGPLHETYKNVDVLVLPVSKFFVENPAEEEWAKMQLQWFQAKAYLGAIDIYEMAKRFKRRQLNKLPQTFAKYFTNKLEKLFKNVVDLLDGFFLWNLSAATQEVEKDEIAKLIKAVSQGWPSLLIVLDDGLMLFESAHYGNDKAYISKVTKMLNFEQSQTAFLGGYLHLRDLKSLKKYIHFSFFEQMILAIEQSETGDVAKKSTYNPEFWYDVIEKYTAKNATEQKETQIFRSYIEQLDSVLRLPTSLAKSLLKLIGPDMLQVFQIKGPSWRMLAPSNDK